jgi:hypothetical protein
MDPNSGETFDLPIARGDKLILFTRVNDADVGRSRYLGANGDVVEVRQVLPDGMRIRNADGEEGRITWSQMKPWRAPKNDPIRATMGLAVTVDSAQSMTKTAAIYSLPEGSGMATGYKGYTAMSRHTGEAHLVVSDAAERKAIVKRQMLGAGAAPSRADVIRNITTNLSRFATKRQATTTLEQAIDVHRHSIRSFHRGTEAVQRDAMRESHHVSGYEMSRLAAVVQQMQQRTMDIWSATVGVGRHRTTQQPERDRGYERER